MNPPKPELPESTFSDHGFQRGRGAAGGSGNRRDGKNNQSSSRAGGPQKQQKQPKRRWSFVLQDVPEMVVQRLNDINKGYTARVAAVAGTAALAGYLVYSRLLVPSQERRPLARRWYLFSPAVPITLLDRTREGSSDMFVYRFALPNSYDYAGYAPVSSVRVSSGALGGLASVSRWYTPISHPEARGYIEFAIRDCDPGRMCGRLRQLQRGDVLYLGRWMKEFDYYGYVRRQAAAGVACPELSIVCSTSGASVALQIMEIMRQDRLRRAALDATGGSDSSGARGGPAGVRLKVLYCHRSPKFIPFKRTYFDPAVASDPNITVRYNVLSPAGVAECPADGVEYGKTVFIGNLDPATLERTISPPVALYPAADAAADAAPVAYRPQVLVCGPKSMQAYLCGHVSAYGNVTYWQGTPLQYSGFMADMGYRRSQVYKFGISKHFLAVQ